MVVGDCIVVVGGTYWLVVGGCIVVVSGTYWLVVGGTYWLVVGGCIVVVGSCVVIGCVLIIGVVVTKGYSVRFQLIIYGLLLKFKPVGIGGDEVLDKISIFWSSGLNPQ